jgi:hypothetical protein
MCTVFTLLHTFPTSSPFYWYQLPRQDLLCPPVLQFCKKQTNEQKNTGIFVCDSYTGSFVGTLPHVHVL